MQRYDNHHYQNLTYLIYVTVSLNKGGTLPAYFAALGERAENREREREKEGKGTRKRGQGICSEVTVAIQ